MFQLTTKLRLLKAELRKIHLHHTSHISNKVVKVKEDWNLAQTILDLNPTAAVAKSTERELANTYTQLCKEESFFKQRSRIQWLQLEDRNTKFFHNSLMHRQVRNRIHTLKDEDDNFTHGQQELGNIATKYYEQILSPPHSPLNANVANIYPKSILDAAKSALGHPISNEEIKAIIFSIPDTKALSPDGFNALFFKKSWNIIWVDFMAAIRFFFSHNHLPRCVNATSVALVSKIENPACTNDFRPISCCNVIYRCISKLLVTRLKAALTDVISPY